MDAIENTSLAETASNVTAFNATSPDENFGDTIGSLGIPSLIVISVACLLAFAGGCYCAFQRTKRKAAKVVSIRSLPSNASKRLGSTGFIDTVRSNGRVSDVEASGSRYQPTSAGRVQMARRSSLSAETGMLHSENWNDELDIDIESNESPSAFRQTSHSRFSCSPLSDSRGRLFTRTRSCEDL